jgi:transposase
MNPALQAQKARHRAALILKVRSGQLTAKAAAQMLGISRQAYYQREQRALQAMLQALEDQPKGRPKGQRDPDKQVLQRRVKQLEHQVQRFEQKEKLRQLLKQWEGRLGRSPIKKKKRTNPPDPGPT